MRQVLVALRGKFIVTYSWCDSTTGHQHTIIFFNVIYKILFSLLVSSCVINFFFNNSDLMDSVVLQLCYDGWRETLGGGRMEYVNVKNTAFVIRKNFLFD